MPAEGGQCYINDTVSRTADILTWSKTYLYKKTHDFSEGVRSSKKSLYWNNVLHHISEDFEAYELYSQSNSVVKGRFRVGEEGFCQALRNFKTNHGSNRFLDQRCCLYNFGRWFLS